MGSCQHIFHKLMPTQLYLEIHEPYLCFPPHVSVSYLWAQTALAAQAGCLDSLYKLLASSWDLVVSVHRQLLLEAINLISELNPSLEATGTIHLL